MNKVDVKKAQNALKDKTAEEVFAWVKLQNKPIMASTSFGPDSAVMLHLISCYAPEIPIVWVDSGYNLREVYQVAEQLMGMLKLNMHIYSPEMTTERRNVIMGGIPGIDDSLHGEFTRQVKLEPFARAIAALKPDIWLAGIREADTDYRKDLGQVSYDNRGLLRVSPIFHWSDTAIRAYMEKYHLPTCKKYFDPTKAQQGRECGLHTSISAAKYALGCKVFT